jgi:hypothetical protein
MKLTLDYRYAVFYDGDVIALCNSKSEAECIGEAQNDDTYTVVELPEYRIITIDVPEEIVPENAR